MRRALPALGLWIVLASALSILTTRFRDWFAMPNELLYQRRAISIADTLSPLPRVREELVSTFDQLYPLLVAPAFRWGYVPDELWTAHLLNAWIMSSACIPAFLLARRLTTLWWPPYVAALLTVCMPWIVVSSFLLTEVAAYPAFVWAMLGMHVATAAPSRRNDVLALLGIGLAFFGRTQLAVLFFLLPVTIVAVELGRSGGVREALRVSLAGHRVLAVVYGGLAAVGLVLAGVGHLPGVLGVYGATIGGTGSSLGESLSASAFAGSLVEHVATFALGLAILPFVVGVAWLLANLVRPPASRELHTFACLGAITVVATVLEVTIFDLRFGADFVHDRYLFYLVPLVVIGALCAVLDSRVPRWSLALPAALVCLGFMVGEIPGFLWRDYATVNSDGPISALYRPLVDAAGSLTSTRGLLVAATIVLAVLFVQASILFRPRLLTSVFVGFLLVAIPAITAYMFARVFDEVGWSGRPVSALPEAGFDWVDRTVGADARVAMVPYPVSTSYFVNQGVWRDYEFWNRSVRRDVQFPEKTFLFTGDTFAKIFPRFDPATGASDVSLAPHVLQANQESRFRIAGNVRVLRNDVMLIDAAMPWRLDWLTTGLHADGWTRPGVPARIRVYAAPGQRGPVTRGLSIGFRAPEDVAERPVTITSNLERVETVATPGTQRAGIRVCVPARGYADVTVRAEGASPIPGDLRDIDLSRQAREGGIFLNEIALADELGEPCRPRQG
jgi:hypothetical protein